MKNILLFTIVLTLCACASSPQLYPNQKLQTVGKEQADKDIKQCTELAETYLKSSKGKQVAKSAGAGAIVGGAIGGAFGLLTGNVGRGVVRGAAVGGVGGAASGAVSPDQLKKNFINKCLAERGYEVIGWD
jgi:outer membrane lipoprotein SlyB